MRVKEMKKYGHLNTFLIEEEPVKMQPEAETPHKHWFSSTNLNIEWVSYCVPDCRNARNASRKFV